MPQDHFVVKIQRELLSEIRPKSFGTFEKRAPDLFFLWDYGTAQAVSWRKNEETFFFRLWGRRRPE